MNEGLIPKRYAKALYKFALEKGDTKRLYATMATLARSFDDNAQLAVAVANPFVDDSRKTSLLMTAAGADAATDTVYADFLKLLTQNRRLGYARECALAYLDIYRHENRIYPVAIVSAKPLDADEKARIEALLAKHLPGATMEYSYSTDPALIGGFTVTVGSERLDATVANELKQLSLKLLAK